MRNSPGTLGFWCWILCAWWPSTLPTARCATSPRTSHASCDSRRTILRTIGLISVTLATMVLTATDVRGGRVGAKSCLIRHVGWKKLPSGVSREASARLLRALKSGGQGRVQCDSHGTFDTRGTVRTRRSRSIKRAQGPAADRAAGQQGIHRTTQAQKSTRGICPHSDWEESSRQQLDCMERGQLSLPKSQIRAYLWCNPPRIGWATKGGHRRALWHQLVTARFGDQDGRVGGVFLDLLPQPVDVRLKCVSGDLGIVAPDFLQQGLTRYRTLGGTIEISQDPGVLSENPIRLGSRIVG